MGQICREWKNGTFSMNWWNTASKGTRMSFAISSSCIGTGSLATLGFKKYCQNLSINQVREYRNIYIFMPFSGTQEFWNTSWSLKSTTKIFYYIRKISHTWKGLRSARRTVSALMVLHRNSELLLIRLLFWIADRKSDTSSDQEFCLTNSATAIILNWKNITGSHIKRKWWSKVYLCVRNKQWQYHFNQNFQDCWFDLEQS